MESVTLEVTLYDDGNTLQAVWDDGKFDFYSTVGGVNWEIGRQGQVLVELNETTVDANETGTRNRSNWRGVSADGELRVHRGSSGSYVEGDFDPVPVASSLHQIHGVTDDGDVYVFEKPDALCGKDDSFLGVAVPEEPMLARNVETGIAQPISEFAMESLFEDGILTPVAPTESG